MIKLQVIGNLGKDCVQGNVNGRTVLNFTVAHTERYKDAQGGPVEKTTWVDCAYWTDRLAVAPYLKKGQLVYVEGTPEARAYTKNDGALAATITLRISNIQLLGGSKEASEQGNSNSMPSSGVSSTSVLSNDSNDSLPF